MSIHVCEYSFPTNNFCSIPWHCWHQWLNSRHKAALRQCRPAPDTFQVYAWMVWDFYSACNGPPAVPCPLTLTPSSTPPGSTSCCIISRQMPRISLYQSQCLQESCPTSGTTGMAIALTHTALLELQHNAGRSLWEAFNLLHVDFRINFDI